MCLATRNNLLLVLYIGHPKMYIFHELAIFCSAENRCKDTLFSILHHLSPVIFANATVLAFLLLLGYRFNFHCYTQREPTPTQKSARKRQLRPLATSCAKDYEGHSLVQTSFSEPPNISRSMAMALLSFQEDLRPLPLSVPLSVRRSMVWCPWFYARREK